MVNEDALFDEAVELFAEKGTKMTMDELARRLRISKRTLYEAIGSKEDLAVFVIDRYFAIVEERQEPVRNDPSLSPTEKLRAVLSTTPSMPRAPFKLSEIRYSYPRAYARLDERLSGGWSRTFEIIDEGVRAGEFRPVNKDLFAALFASSIEGVMSSPDAPFGLSFSELQREIVDILVDGIRA